MTCKEYQEGLMTERKFLDKIDLIPYLNEYETISNIMDMIKFNYGQNIIFNFMDRNDFMNYLKNRYPKIYFYEYTEYIVKNISTL